MSAYNEKQIQIMEAAEKLFADKGFEGTSVRDIAEDAGVNQAMISYYFGSKEKLMEAMFTYRGTSSLLQLEEMVQDKTLTPIQKVDKLIDRYIEKLLTNQCFHRVVVREQMVNNNGFISDKLQEIKRLNQALIKELIAQGQRNGDFKKHVDIPLLMITLVGTVSHLITTQHFYREINNLQSLTEEEFQKHIRKKLSHHLKAIFKATLMYEQ
ncbi:MAG TPA: TetR family transcriptional regulator [Chitinophagaceae bacterium]|nr:TetR family transcriptional regulator [Chitinophagaceae bacterium]